MYPNLLTDMLKADVTLKMASDHLKITVELFERKLKGGTFFTLNEAKKLKAFIHSERPLEELFEEA